jgi:hypothetical protein
MKLISYFSLAAACFAHVSIAYSADADLIGLIKDIRQTSAIMTHLEPSPEPSGTTDGQRRILKPISAYGGIFDGLVSFKAGIQNETRLWTREPLLSPEAALKLFDKIASSLKSELGQGRTVANIPNYADASDVKSTAVLWLIETEIILLHVDQYPRRGGVGLVRCSREAWRSSMGADESDFWEQALDSKTGDESLPETQEQQAPGKSVNAPITTHSEESNAPEAKPTATPSEEPASSTPWSIIVVLIVAASGLLWLLLKRRS